MKIHHLRNATFIIETGARFILVDPMLGRKGSGMPFTLFRFKARKNPTVELPEIAERLLDRVTHCLITHLHPDHIDQAAAKFLAERKIPVACSHLDRKKLEKQGLNIQLALQYWEPQNFLEGNIIGIPAIHGYGFVRKIAGNVMGFYLELQGDSSTYISSDTIYTDHVDRVLKEYEPDISVVAAGMAQLDFGDKLLMNEQDIVKFVQQSPGQVIANHMEALNHCPNTRASLKRILEDHDLIQKVLIPSDGETLSF